MSKYFADLAYAYTDAFDDAYNNAETRTGTVNLPDGRYQGFVDEFRIDEGNNGALALQIKLICITPPYAGKAVYRRVNFDLDNYEQTAQRIKGDLTTLGFEWEGLRSLDDESKCAAMLDQIVDFTVTHKTAKNRKGEEREYMNVWLNRVSGVIDGETRQNLIGG